MFSTLTDRLIASIISIGSLLFPFMENIEPTFRDIKFNTSGNVVVLSLYLDNWYTEQLNQVISSGQTIKLFYQLDLLQESGKKPVQTKRFYHTVRYSLLDNRYEILTSETGRLQYFPDISEVHSHFTTVTNFPVLKSGDLESGKDYYFRLTAYLENIAFIGDDSDFNLMFFWNDKNPSVNTEVFNSTIFLY